MLKASVQDELSPRRFPDLPPMLAIRALMFVRRILLNLANRLLPADAILFEHATGVAGTVLLGSVARLQLADLIADGSFTAKELAAKTGVDPDALHRTMRALATKGIFELLPDGRYRNNRLSEALQSGKLKRSQEWVRYFASESNLAAWADFEQTLRTGRSAFPRVHGQSIWDYFESHPQERERFAQAMMGLTVTDAPMIAALYPFREVGRVCEVGAGRGTLLSELLIRYPHLTGVWCDGPGLRESAIRLLEARGVQSRVEMVAGSFFERLPLGCDAYLLKNILHDWDDDACVRILRVCREAMTPTARLLVVENLTETNLASGIGPLADIQMMVACDDGRERSRDDFARLFEASGFRLARTYEGPTISIVEGRLD